MNNIVARPVVKNKFWIVESDGQKSGTILTIEEDGGVVYVHDNQREHFPSIKLLSKKYNIQFAKLERPKTDKQDVYEVYGFPSKYRPHNEVLDVQRYLPIFTKSSKSKSFYCAGFYIVKLGNAWVKTECPKLITLNRYEYQGPFKTEDRMKEAMNEANGQ